HHFNKAQQDILLPDVESGNLRLIGATTYNPFFYVNSALVSRSQVFRLEPLRVEQLEQLIDRALTDKERGLGNYNVKIDKNARRHLAKLSDGDARKCLNALEIGVLTTPPSGKNGTIHFTLAVAEESIQQKAVVYDRVGDAHYDTISAFIKSMRASDEKGAMYWLAKMLHAGEDFRFIARRIVIFASEDVGLADPEALPLAIATQQAVESFGMHQSGEWIRAGEAVSRFLQLIRFSHTIFALPFALGALIVAANGWPSLRILVLVVVCMVFARTAAMLFNRLIDWSLDQRNPCTASRHLLISKSGAIVLLAVSSG